MEVGKRLSEYIEKQGFSKPKFCEKYEIDYNGFVRILADKRPIGINVLHQVHNALPNLNVHWVLYGEGPMEINESILNEPKEAYKINKDSLLKLLSDKEFKDVVVKIIQDEIGKTK
jgi:hypothetical protein